MLGLNTDTESFPKQLMTVRSSKEASATAVAWMMVAPQEEGSQKERQEARNALLIPDVRKEWLLPHSGNVVDF